MDLFDEADGSSKLAGLKVNQGFAEAFDKRKKAEELSKLHDKYGSAEEDSESSTDYSSEDSEAELATAAVDVAILKTLARIRKGDASIYEAGRNIFEEEESALPVASSSKSTLNGKKSKAAAPLSLSAYQRETLLANRGIDEDEPSQPTPAEEAEALRRETKAAFLGAAASDDEEDEDEDDLLVPRLKTQDEEEQEAQEYRDFITQQAGNDALELAEGEEFLRDFMLNRGWLDKQSKHIPTHEEVLETKPSKKSKGKAKEPEHGFEPLVEDDDEFEDRAEDFETRYNFRFEQSGGDEIVTHSRAVDDSVRRPDVGRTEKRKKAAEEKAKRKEEKLRLKAEERAERDRLRDLQDSAKQDRLAKLKEAVGAGVEGVDEMDLDSDFDPAEHDRRMARMFDERFYGAADEEKPTWEDSDLDDEHLPYVNAEEDEAYDPSAAPIKESKKERKKKRKREAAEAAAAAGENAEEDDEEALRKKYNAFFDRFEYEDLVDDQPTRFHYAPVEAAGFELTPEEILMATDAELNTYVGLSKLHTYRQPGPPKNRSRRRKELRGILSKRAWGDEVDREDIEQARELLQRRRRPADGAPTGANATAVVPKKRKGKKEREKQAKKATETAPDP